MDAELDGTMLLEWIVGETGVGMEDVEAVLYSFTKYMARMGQKIMNILPFTWV